MTTIIAKLITDTTGTACAETHKHTTVTTPATATAATTMNATTTAPQFVYRLCTEVEWEQALKSQFLEGNALDQKSGFIHLSTLEQSVVTAEKYFNPSHRLVLLALTTTSIQPSLSWDYVADRQEYLPHLHVFPRRIPLRLVSSVYMLGTNPRNFPLQYNPYVIKFVTIQEWKDAIVSGVYTGNEKDHKDGFIHLSTPDQVHWLANRLSKLSTDQQRYKLTFDVKDLSGPHLRWEHAASAKSMIFPHIYGSLEVRWVCQCELVRLDELATYAISN